MDSSSIALHLTGREIFSVLQSETAKKTEETDRAIEPSRVPTPNGSVSTAACTQCAAVLPEAIRVRFYNIGEVKGKRHRLENQALTVHSGTDSILSVSLRRVSVV